MVEQFAFCFYLTLSSLRPLFVFGNLLNRTASSAGNVLFRQLIMENCIRYKECMSRGDCRDEMNAICQSIIDQVHAEGGRFIDKTYKGWMELSQKQRIEKVAR